MLNRIKNEKLYTVSEVAEMLQLRDELVYKFARTGKLKAFKFGGAVWRIAESDLNEFLFVSSHHSLKGGE